MTTYESDVVMTPVIPSFRGYLAKLTAGTVGASRIVGLKSGLEFTKAFAGVKAPRTNVAALQQKITRETEINAGKVEAAKKREAAASRQVEIAELKLSETRKKSNVTTSQEKVAEDRLTIAKEKAEVASRTAAKATAIESDAAKRNAVALNQAQAASSRHGKTLGILNKTMRGAAVAGGLVAAAVGFGLARGIKTSIPLANKFDAQMRLAGTTLGATQTQMKGLTDLAIEMGAKTSFSAQGAADAMVELAKGGMTQAQIAGGALQQTLTLATAGGLELGDAATYVSNGLNAFHLDASQANQITYALAGAANASTASVESLGQGLSQVSAQAAGMGLSVQDTSAALAAFDNAGIKGSDAGTSLKRMLQLLQPQTKATRDAFLDLGLTTFNAQKAQELLRSRGIKPLGTDQDTLTGQLQKYAMELAGADSYTTAAQKKFSDLAMESGALSNRFFDAQGNVRSLAEMQGVLKSATAGMTKEQRSATLQQLFGSDASRAALVLTDTSTKAIKSYTAAANDKAGAEALAKNATSGYAGAQERLEGGVESLQIQFGKYLLPAMTKVMNYISASLLPVFSRFVDVVGPKLGPALVSAAHGFGQIVQAATTIATFMINNATAVKIFAGALVGVSVAAKAGAIAMSISEVGLLRYLGTLKIVQFATKVWTGVQLAARAATTVFTLAMKGLRIVMATAFGPIGLIITAIGLLVTGFIYAYTHSSKFRAIVQGALHGVAAAGQFMWNNVLKPAFAGLVAAFHVVVAVGRAVGAGLSATFHAVAAAAIWLWNTILKPQFLLISAAFRAVGAVFRAVWKGFLSPVFQLLGAIVKWLAVKIFQAYLGIIRAAWRAMGNSLKSVYTSIIKPIINAFATVGKWLWNNILKPAFAGIRSGFGLVGDKLHAVWANFIKPILNAYAALGKSVWEKFLKPAWASIRTAFGAVGDKLRSVYDAHIKPILNAFGSVATAAKDTAAKAFGGIKSAWTSTKDHLSSVFHGTMTNVFEAFKSAGSGMKDAFGTAVSGIGTGWAKLSELAKKPIRFIIDSVINKGLIKGFNSLARTFGTTQLKWLPLPFSNGGIYPGYTPGRDIGLAAVSGGEPIMRPEFGRAVGEPWVNAANAAARRGGVGGAKRFLAAQNYGAYASGGIVKPTRSGRQNQSYAGHSGIDFYGGVGDPILAATAGRISYTGSGRGYGNAIFEQAANGLQMVYGHTSRIMARVGQMVKAGQQIGQVGYSGNVRPPGPAGAHLHFEIAPNGAFAQASNRDATQKWLGGSGVAGKIIGAIAGIASNLDPAKLIKGAVDKALGAAKWLAATPFGQMAAAMPKYVAGKAIAFAKDKFAGFFAGDGVSSSWSGAGVGSLGRDQLNVAATIIKTAKSLGFGQRGAMIGLMTAMQESTLRELSGGDRDSVGPFQQRAPWGPFAKRKNAASSAAMFFNGGDGGQPGLRSKNWQHLPLGVAAQQVQVSAFPDAYNKWEGLARQLVGKGYAGGTTNAAAGLHKIAEFGPELVTRPSTRMFTGGEQVRSASDTALLGSRELLIKSGALDIRNGKAYIADAVAEIAGEAALSY